MTYTSHGHHIAGTTTDDEHGQISRARCGGPAICTVCQKDAAKYYKNIDSNFSVEEDFEGSSDDNSESTFIKLIKLSVVGSYNNYISDDMEEISIDQLIIMQYSQIAGHVTAIVTHEKIDKILWWVSHNKDYYETVVKTYSLSIHDRFSQEGNV